MNKQPFDQSIFRLMYETIPEGICIIDSNGTVLFDNPAARLFNKGKSLVEYSAGDLFQCIDLDNGESPIQECISDGKMRTSHGLFIAPDGGAQTVAYRIFQITPKNQSEKIFAVFIRDNAEDLENQERMRVLETQCLVDPLTELPNRTMLESNLTTRFHEYERFGWAFGVMMIDIDHFKQFNDKYGHDVGDIVLQSTGRILSKNLRPFDIVGRWGGEEFVAVVANVDRLGLLSAAERTRFQVQRNRIPVNGQNLKVTVSIGATLCSQDDNAETIIKRADQVMYESKSNGRNKATVI
ncbi:diguanylate cyclase [bacterium]|nr:diguanylate cyclase [bacterium]